MAIAVSQPGVYFEEFAPGAPIEGVGTSTAAFLGLTKYGPSDEPKKLFRWEDFLREFGNPSGTSEPPDDDDYLWYGVRGFFENGGRVCYVTRVSNAKVDSKVLLDDGASQTGAPAAQPTIEIRARVAKDHRPTTINVAVTHVQVVQTTLFAANTTLKSGAGRGTSVLEVASPSDAAKFRSGDTVVIEETGVNSELVTVTRVDGGMIRLSSPLQASYSATATVQLAEPNAESTELRFVDSTTMLKLAAGSVIKLVETVPSSSNPVTLYAMVKSVTPEVTASLKTWRVALQRKLGLGLRSTSTEPVTVESQEFKLDITGPVPKAYDGLSMSPGHPKYFVSEVNNDPNGPVYVLPVEPPNTTDVPFNRPKEISATALVGGQSEVRSTIGASDYGRSLSALRRIDDINIVSAPGVAVHSVQQALIVHCEELKDRFAVLDSPRGVGVSGPGSVVEHRGGVDSVGGFAALYYPWLRVPAAEGNRLLLVAPSGHVAGVYSRIDGSRGVHKAPAGMEATLNGVLAIEKPLSDEEHGDLNKNHGINVVRVFQTGGRAVVWGARTTATNKNWQYVSVRRLFLFLQESIHEGIRWAVHEPNNLELWQQLKRTITAFLAQQWRDGALFGKTEREAFYVRIDEALNPPDQRALGRLTLEIGVKPSYPAEFIVVRIGIWQGGSDVTE